eukprot:COSAG01_NODE_52398_length_347_cov_0.479839_1_plen_61_part_10
MPVCARSHIVGCGDVHAVIRRVGQAVVYCIWFGCRTCFRIVSPEAFRRMGRAIMSVHGEDV